MRPDERIYKEIQKGEIHNVRRLEMAISSDDEAFREGGPLETKHWIVGDICIRVQSGYDYTFAGIHCARHEPKLDVRSARNVVHAPDFSQPFNVHEFEARLQDAKNEVKRMNDFLDEAYDALLERVATKK